MEIHRFKDNYDKLYSTFFSKLDDNNSEIIIRESCPICGFRVKLYKFNIYKFPIVQCKRCLFIYREKTISQYILGRWRAECVDFYYKEKGQKNELTEKPYQDLVNNRATKLKMIFKKMNFSPQGKNFLDIGCAIGTTCVAANLLGMNAFGIDIDPGRGRNIDILERHKSDFTFIKGDFLDLSLKENNFDFIITNHTLEHIVDIKRFIQKISVILNDDGIFVVAVPNLDSMNNVVFGERYSRQWQIAHENFFDLHHLEILLKMYNLKICTTWTEEHSFFATMRNPVVATIFTESTYNNKKETAWKSKRIKKESFNSIRNENSFLKSLFRKYVQGEGLYVVAKK